MYQTFGVKCETIATDLLDTRHQERRRGAQRRDQPPELFYEPMNLTEYAAAGS